MFLDDSATGFLGGYFFLIFLHKANLLIIQCRHYSLCNIAISLKAEQGYLPYLQCVCLKLERDESRHTVVDD